MSRTGGLKELKTESGRRDVVLMPESARLLRRHKQASRYSREGDFVFASAAGTPLNWRNVEARGFDEAAKGAKLSRTDGQARPARLPPNVRQPPDRKDSMRFTRRQLGHANPATTLRIYGHLFDRVNHAARMPDALSAGFGVLLNRPRGNSEMPGEARRPDGRSASPFKCSVKGGR